MGMRIRRDDVVKIITGKDRGKTGRVLRVDPERQRVYVEGVAIQKRHIRPRTLRDTQRQQEIGGIVEQPGPIHVSNVMLVDPKSGQATRVGVRRDGGRRVRVAKRSGEDID
ncbi:MAG TPA: 50S ribosomal protein L24 [Thermoleophilaceae bacterium]|jgi:large subunit ribosomal protein L24|nr:50S ribosomal protein L24 [Thermoleophilaceae bacterium]